MGDADLLLGDTDLLSGDFDRFLGDKDLFTGDFDIFNGDCFLGEKDLLGDLEEELAPEDFLCVFLKVKGEGDLLIEEVFVEGLVDCLGDLDCFP